MDVAVSHSILSAVSNGELGETFRLYVPERVVAFGRSDRRSPGYAHAVRIAEAHGYAAVERLAGGRAAVFHPATLAFSWATPDPEPAAHTIARFRFISTLMANAFRSLGVDARIGAVAGEYCAGDWSVNVGGRVKVMGVGQRLVRNAAHVGGVVVVDDGYRIRDVLIPIYRSLQIDWDPRTAGSLADRSPGLDNDRVAEAITRQLEETFLVTRDKLPTSIVSEAHLLIDDHLPKVA
jgi:lipoate-protein ligase A